MSLATATSGSTIILVRHGEKIEWDNGLEPSAMVKASYVDNHELSGKGFERAHALTAYFRYRPEMRRVFDRAPLAAIFYQSVDEGAYAQGKSLRPKQTVDPLIGTLKASTSVEITGFKKRQALDMVSRLNSETYAGRTVIVSWSHQHLCALAVALGCSPGSTPPKWGSRFDVTWVLEPVDDGSKSISRTLSQIPQRLMYGDKDEVIKVKDGFAGDFRAILSSVVSEEIEET